MALESTIPKPLHVVQSLQKKYPSAHDGFFGKPLLIKLPFLYKTNLQQNEGLRFDGNVEISQEVGAQQYYNVQTISMFARELPIARNQGACHLVGSPLLQVQAA